MNKHRMHSGLLLLSLSFTGLPSLRAQVVDVRVELLFADGLLGRGYLDLAERQMDGLIALRGISSRDRAAIHFAYAEFCDQMAQQVLRRTNLKKIQKLQLKEKYLKKSLENLDKGLKLDPSSERAAQSIFRIGRILKERALTKKKNWETMEYEKARINIDPKKPGLTEEEKKKLARKAEIEKTVPKEKASAVKLLNTAVKYFETLATQKAKLHKDLKAKIAASKDSKKQAAMDKQATVIEIEMVLAQYEWYSIQVYLGEIEGPKTPKGKKAIEDAVKNLKVLSDRYDQWVIGKYALMLEGYGHCMLENYESAFAKFKENTKENNNDAIDDVIQKTYYRWASGVKESNPKKYPSKKFPARDMMVIYLIEGMKIKVTPEQAKTKIGLKEIGKQYGVDPHDLMKLNKKDAYTCRRGETVIIYNGLFVRYDGIEDDKDIGKASALILGEAYVSLSKSLRSQKKSFKEWSGKARRGFFYVEKIAQGKDAWSYKASLLLADWEKVMKEIQYESPIQLYSKGNSLFTNARTEKDPVKRMSMYDGCIEKMQKVVSIYEGMGETKAFSTEKVVDAWFKIGASYYMTQRLSEAALAWNACARNFPTEPNGEKAGSLSTSIMGKLYKDTPKASKPTVSYFYEEILDDFIQLFPATPKAADSQFIRGEVVRARGANLRAAGIYEKVKPSSKYYDKARYLIGICYMNEFYKLYRNKEAETPGAKDALQKADEALGRFIDWADAEQAPRDVLVPRKQTQARAAFNRSTLSLFPMNQNADKVLGLLVGYEGKYSEYLSKKDQSSLYPQVIFTRLKAYVLKNNLTGAKSELKLLLAYPDSKDLGNAYKYVAGVFMKEAEQKDKALEVSRKKLEELKANSDAGAEALEKQIAADEKEIGAIRVKAADQYYEFLTKAKGKEPSIFMFAADTYFINERHDRAAYLYGVFLKSYANDPQFKDKILDIKFRAGQSYFHQKEYTLAIAHLKAAADSYKNAKDPKRFLVLPYLSDSLKEKGKSLRAEKKTKEANELFQEALTGWAILKNSYKADSPEWWRPMYEIAELYYLMGKYDDCLKHISITNQMYPKMGGPELKRKFIWLVEQLIKIYAKDRAKLNRAETLLENLKKVDK